MAATVLIALVILGAPAFGQEKGFSCLRLAYAPTGGYDFRQQSADFSGGFHELTFAYSYDIGRA
jgi:hypothetical protein